MALTETPLMKQYQEMKAKHPNAVVMFRIGDFYEMYGEDAIAASEILGITLTRRANGKDNFISLAGFPHHALDTYLPRLVRAGRQVAICEQLEGGKQKEVETVTPAAVPEQTTTDAGKKNETKEINCRLSLSQLRDLGEPTAYFTAKIPKAAKNLGKQTSNIQARFEPICIQPELGKIIATDSNILTAMDVECHGDWPKANGSSPFECFVDSKAISGLAGKEIDIAVWSGYKGDHYVTCCETEGLRTQYQLTGAKYPDWKRVMPDDSGYNVMIAEQELDLLRKFVKANMGRTKAERKLRFAVLHASKDADDLLIRIMEQKEEYSDEWDTVAEQQFDMREYDSRHEFQIIFRADLFYYSIQEDFNGSMWIRDISQAVKFTGILRETILMPSLGCDGLDSYFK